MAEIVGLVLIIVSSAVTVVALLVLLPFLIPHRVERTRQVMQATPGRCFIIGLANALFFLVIAAIVAQGGDGGGLLALLIVLALLALAAVGLAGLVLLLRERIYPETEKTAIGLRVMVKTAVLLLLATLLPLVGWFVLTPILLLISLGAAITTLVRRRLPVNSEP